MSAAESFRAFLFFDQTNNNAPPVFFFMLSFSSLFHSLRVKTLQHFRCLRVCCVAPEKPSAPFEFLIFFFFLFYTRKNQRAKHLSTISPA